MPKLDNVTIAPDLTTIGYGGNTYYRLADGEGAKDGDLFYVSGSNRTYVKEGGVYSTHNSPATGVLQLYDEDRDWLPVKSPNSYVSRSGIFFRKGPADKRAELTRLETEAARLRAEIEAEEAEAARIKVGDWIRGTDNDGNPNVVGVVTEVDSDDDELPFNVDVATGTYAWLSSSAVKITPAEARAAILAWLDDTGATA